MNYKSNEPCVACRLRGENFTCYHHLKTRKAFPEYANERWNMISVCQQCHNHFHNHGISYMARKFKTVFNWLSDNLWYHDDLSGWNNLNEHKIKRELKKGVKNV